MKFKVLSIIAILICFFGFNAYAKEKTCFQENFTAYPTDTLLTSVSERWSDFRDRGFTQWKPYVAYDPVNISNKVLAIDKNTESGANKNEHLITLQDKVTGIITASMRFYIPSDKKADDGTVYNSIASNEKFVAGIIDSSNAANYLVYSYISPNTADGATVYSHGSTKIVEKDRWHTLKMTVDTQTGIRETYLDGTLIYSSVVIEDIKGKYMGEFRISAPGTMPKSIFYADDIKVTIPDTDWDYDVKDIIYSDGDVYFNTPENGASLKTITIEKSSSAGGNGMIVAAGFNKDKELETVKFASFKASDFSSNEASVSIDMQVNEDTDIKVFIWDKDEKICPLADVFIPEKSEEISLYLIGDSTMETYGDNSYPRAGLGQMMGKFFEGINVVNYGSSGKTTETYLEYEGWTKTLKNVKCGDYVVIQLGINDAIYAVGADTYKQNLKTMTDTLLKRGVNVIVNTPTVRRMFKNGKFRATFDENGNFITTDVYTNGNENYLDAVRNFIAENSDRTGFFSVDMTDVSATLIGPNAAPDDSSRRFYMQDAYYNWDNVYKDDVRASGSKYADKNSNNYKNNETDHTHLTLYGATVYAQGMAKEISKMNIPLSEYAVNLDKVIAYPNGDVINAAEDKVNLYGAAPLVSSQSDNIYELASNITDDNSMTYWKAGEDGGTQDYGKSLMLGKNDSGNYTVIASYVFAPQTEILTFEHDILVTEIVSEKAFPYFFSSDGDIALTTVVTEGRIVATGSTILSETEPGKWYNIKYVMNIPERTCDVYLDGVLKLDDKKFREDAENISKIQYHISPGSTGGLYVDNIKITSDKSLLNENFESYAESSTLPSDWGNAPGSGSTGIKKYVDNSSARYPQKVITDLGRLGYIEKLSVTFPHGYSYKFEAEVSKDGKGYTHVALLDDKFYGGTVELDFSPVCAKYVRITYLDGKDNAPASMSELKVWWQGKSPVENLAFCADVSASSRLSGMYDALGVKDNIIASFDKIGEWRSSSNDSAPWLKFTWNEEKAVDRIVLYGSAQQGENIKKGTLTFSDGSRMEVSELPTSGKPLVIDFEPKNITWVRFTVTEFEKACAISEMQIYPVGEKPELVEYIEPWKVVTINEDYASKWLVSADIDNDGEVELISCRSASEEFNIDNHSVKTACAMELDGSYIWTWGTKGEGVTTLGADSPCQVYDIDNDGVFEVLLCTQTELVILDARNGREEKRYPLPVGQTHPEEWATDCIVIANISGNDYPSDIIVKSRYKEAWAYTKDWKLIWHVSTPGGMNIGHQPLPVDIDHDGYDEVMVGYSLVNPDGTYRWIMDKNEYGSDLDGSGSHSDSVKILPFEEGTKPEDIRICLCLCGACDIVMIDGNGKRVWAAEDGMHYETILTGKLMKDSDETYIVSNPNIARWMNSESGNQPIYIYDAEGNLLVNRFGFDWNRKPSIVNWSGNEDWIYMPADGVLVDINMNIMARTLSPVRGHDSAMAYNISMGDKAYYLDFNGDGRQDLANLTDTSGKVELYIYLNENGKIVADDIGSGYNVTFY